MTQGSVKSSKFFAMRLKEVKTTGLTDIHLIDRWLLLGPSGIGKTEIIKDIARQWAYKLGKQFINLNETNPPEDLFNNPDKYFVFYRIIGPYFNYDLVEYPYVQNGSVRIIPNVVFSALQACEGLLFVDEITNIQVPHIRSQMYSLLDQKEIGANIKLNKTVIVSAGNRVDHSEDADTLPKPLRNRLCIIDVYPDFEAWMEWYKNADCYNAYVAAFLSENQDLLHTDVIKDDGYVNFATPRTWERISVIVNKLGKDVNSSIVNGFLGPKIGDMFITYLKYNVDFERLKEDTAYWDKLSRSQKMIAAFYIAHKIGQEWTKLLDHMMNTNKELVKLIIDNASDKSDIKVVINYSQKLSRVQ